MRSAYHSVEQFKILDTVRTKYCYEKAYIEQLFSESEISRLMSKFQTQLKMRKIKVVIYPDFVIEYLANQLNRQIDTSQKKLVSQIILDHDCKYNAIWHGSGQLFAINDIMNELGGTINRQVDRKKRTQKPNYTRNMINGLYKNAKFTTDDSLQLFAGF